MQVKYAMKVTVVRYQSQRENSLREELLRFVSLPSPAHQAVEAPLGLSAAESLSQCLPRC